jgi:hypothetical protein
MKDLWAQWEASNLKWEHPALHKVKFLSFFHFETIIGLPGPGTGSRFSDLDWTGIQSGSWFITPESTGWLIEDQAFSPPDVLSPPPPQSPPVSQLDRRHTERLRKRENLLTGEGVGAGGGAKSYDNEKSWSYINHSTESTLSVKPQQCMFYILANPTITNIVQIFLEIHRAREMWGAGDILT